MQDVLCTVYFNALLICQAGYASTGTQKLTKANVPVGLHGLGTANIPNNVIALYFYGVTSPSQQRELAKCDTCNAVLLLWPFIMIFLFMW